MQLVKKGQIGNGDLVMTDFQISGRGQRGNNWQSSPGENLLFSFVLNPDNMLAKDQFLLQRMVSIALVEALFKEFSIETKIKWPNDLYLGNLKIAGTLIENTLSGNQIDTSVIGIGLNVNQEDFDGLKATSIRNVAGKILDRDKVLEAILLSLEANISNWLDGQEHMITDGYIRHLYWFREQHTFRFGESLIMGAITGVSPSGKLRIQMEKGVQEFDIKEIVYIE